MSFGVVVAPSAAAVEAVGDANPPLALNVLIILICSVRGLISSLLYTAVDTAADDADEGNAVFNVTAL